MSNLQDMAMSALTFNKEGLTRAGEEEDSTTPAIILILLASVVSGIVGYVTGTTQFSNPADPTATVDPVTALVSNLVGQLLFFLLISAVIALMLGAEATTMEVFRVAGATSIWTTIGAVVGFVVSGLSGIIGLIGFIALIIGLSGISKKGALSTFIRVIIAYILVFLIILALVIFVFFAIFAGTTI